MGNQQFSSPYSVSSELQVEVDNERWVQLVDSAYALDVNLAHLGSATNPFRYLYTVMINPTNPSHDCRLILLFPQHPIPKQRILYTDAFQHMHQLSNEINKRIRDSLFNNGVPVLQILCGNRLFRVSSFSGTIYMVWCKRVNQMSRNEQKNKIANMTPALVEMDGHGRGRSIILLEPEHGRVKLLPLADLRVMVPIHVLIFSCETQRPPDRDPPIKTHSEDEALSKTTECALDVSFKIPALSPAISDVDSDGEMGELQFIASTPRAPNPMATTDNEEIPL